MRRHFLRWRRHRRIQRDDQTRRIVPIFATEIEQWLNKINEATRTITIAFGASLIACITGIGSAWKYPELHQPFQTLIKTAVVGLGASIVLNVFLFGVIQSILAFRSAFSADASSPQTLQALRRMRLALISYLLALIVVVCVGIIYEGLKIAEMLSTQSPVIL